MSSARYLGVSSIQGASLVFVWRHKNAPLLGIRATEQTTTGCPKNLLMGKMMLGSGGSGDQEGGGLEIGGVLSLL